jgi:hypothetical protein
MDFVQGITLGQLQLAGREVLPAYVDLAWVWKGCKKSKVVGHYLAIITCQRNVERISIKEPKWVNNKMWR